MPKKKDDAELTGFIQDIRLDQQADVDSMALCSLTITELNRLTPRHRAFKMFKVLVDNHSRREVQFNPRELMRTAIVNALRLTSLGAGKINFDDSRTGALVICVYAREAGRCHNCRFARHGCVHPRGSRLSPFGLAKMRERGY